MPADRVIEETIARCVSAMVCYHNSERSVEASESMRSDVQAIAALVTSWRLDADECDDVLNCVRHELLARYGHEAGRRIFAEFDEVFETARMVSTALSA
jgi:hypothetical protein